MMARTSPVAQVDVFTTEAYAGAPAAVCLLDEPRDEGWMASVAKEMACPNTAFALPRATGDGYDLRWFTAGGIEVALCGHATLATAHLLHEQALIAPGAVARFHTKSGILLASRQEDGAIKMDFPVEIATRLESPPDALIEGLRIDPVWVGRNRLDHVVEVASEEVLRSLAPDLAALGLIDTRGIIVTARAGNPAGSGYDYALRFFGPRVGVAEDMVTGTAHCALAPYWRDRFGDERTEFVAYQASPRGGLVGVRLSGDRVLIAGKAVTVLKGELLA